MAADELAAAASASVGIAMESGAEGSGTVICHTPRNSYVLTCDHVLDEGAKRAEIYFRDAAKTKLGVIPAKVVARDPERDLALLRTTKKLDVLNAIGIAAEEPSAYDRVSLVSCTSHFFGAASEGYISDLHNAWGYLLSGGVTIPGGSGGGVFDFEGELVSVQIAIGKTGHLLVPGLCFGVPLPTIHAFLEEHMP